MKKNSLTDSNWMKYQYVKNAIIKPIIMITVIKMVNFAWINSNMMTLERETNFFSHVYNHRICISLYYVS